MFLSKCCITQDELWQPKLLTQVQPASHDLTVKVEQGDAISFVVGTKLVSGKNANAGKVVWDPVITYTQSIPAVWKPNAPGSQNIAFGKYGRSKMLVYTYRPFDAVDGNMSTDFAIYADDKISSGDDWLQLDLDKKYMIDRYAVVSKPRDIAWRPNTFSLQKSDDGFVVDRRRFGIKKYERKIRPAVQQHSPPALCGSICLKANHSRSMNLSCIIPVRSRDMCLLPSTGCAPRGVAAASIGISMLGRWEMPGRPDGQRDSHRLPIVSRILRSQGTDCRLILPHFGPTTYIFQRMPSQRQTYAASMGRLFEFPTRGRFPSWGVGYGVVSGVPSTGLRGSFVFPILKIYRISELTQHQSRIGEQILLQVPA